MSTVFDETMKARLGLEVRAGGNIMNGTTTLPSGVRYAGRTVVISGKKCWVGEKYWPWVLTPDPFAAPAFCKIFAVGEYELDLAAVRGVCGESDELLKAARTALKKAVEVNKMLIKAGIPRTEILERIDQVLAAQIAVVADLRRSAGEAILAPLRKLIAELEEG